MNSVNVTAGTASSLRRWNQNCLSGSFYQVIWPGCVVGVTNQPKQLRVLVDTLRNLVKTLALAHHHCGRRRCIGNESHLLEKRGSPITVGNTVRGHVLVAAAFEKHLSSFKLESARELCWRWSRFEPFAPALLSVPDTRCTG